MNSSSRNRLSPLACQLLSLLYEFSRYRKPRPWSFWREILRASCGLREPDDGEMDAALRALLDAEKVRQASGTGELRFHDWTGDSDPFRTIAAASYGPIDWEATHRFLAKAERAFGDPNPSDGKVSEWEREQELKYLAKLPPNDRYADRLDAFAADFGHLPTASVVPMAWKRATLPPKLDELRLPFDLEGALFAGEPAGGRVERLAEAAARHAALRTPEMVPRVAPLFVWTGRGDLLAAYVESLGASSAALDAAALARGFFGKGWTRMAPKAGTHYSSGGHAQRALLALLCAKFPPPPAKVAEFMRVAEENSSHPDAIRVLFRGASAAWTTPSRRALPQTDAPLAWLGRTLAHALSPDAVQRTQFPEAPQALAAAERAAAGGWTFLAATLGGLLAQYPAVSERALALAAAAPPDEPLLWARTETAKPWDPLLEALEKALAPLRRPARPAAPKKASAETLVATLRLHELDTEGTPCGLAEGETAFLLDSIEPALARPLRGGALVRPDRACTWRALKKSLHAGALGLPPEVAATLDAWISREQPHYGNEAHAMGIGGTGRDTLLDVLLAAGPSVRLRAELEPPDLNDDALDAEERGVPSESPKPVAVDAPDIEPRDLELDTEETDGGALLLRLSDLAWEAESSPLLARDGAVDTRFVWWRVPAALRPFYDFLRANGGQARTVAIPAGGAGKVKEMLEEAAGAGLPVSGAVSSGGAHGGGRRVVGSARLCARLDRRPDGALRLALRARPSPDAPDLLFAPGRGKSEFAVPRLGDPLRVARDLAAEAAAAASARAALADFEGERDSENDWTAEGPERELALLEALRAAAAAAPGGIDLEWRAAPRDRTVVRNVASARLDGSRSADWWLGVTGEFRLDDGERVALRDLLAALPHRVGGYVPLGERAWLRLSSELRRRLEALASAGSVRGGELRVSPAALPMLEDAFAAGEDAGGETRDGAALPALPGALADAAARISDALAAEHPVPEDLAARLRPYQEEGYRWLARLAASGLGGCLADDMGLGKTVQLLAVLLERAGDGPSLVVAPASVCGNWCAEAARFAPGLRVVRAADAAALPEDLGPRDLVVASYGLLASRTAQFARVAWNGAVLDEAQAIKNAETQRAEAAKELRAAWRFAATGTPVENRLSDLWSLFDFLDPGLLGSLDSFRARFLDRDGRPLPALRTLVRPLVLRRLKGEVLRDLPPKTEIALAVDPGDAERAAYEALREESVASLHEGGGARMEMLAALTKLRRFCCSPSLAVPGAGTGAKLEALEALLADLRASGHRALVFSQFTDVLALVKPILERNGWGCEYLDGSTPQKERTRRVEAFQRGSAPFFLVSLKAGGTGLNLTAASYVVLLDPWWNPAVEDQAADRAHRIGQRSAVTVYRLYVRGTVEEKVLALHERKRSLSDAVLDGASDAALSEAELLALLREKNAAGAKAPAAGEMRGNRPT